MPLCAASLVPASPRTEYRTNPLGIDVREPRLSWILNPTNPGNRGLAQSAYQILVASSPQALASGNGDLWDSGKVASDQSSLVVYRGRPLPSGARVWWKVRVWDQAGAESSWSENASWSIGLDPRDWKAMWIGLDENGPKAEQPLPARLLRKEFQLDQKPKRATVYVSGLGLSELCANGAKVGDDVLAPALTDYDKTVLYVTYDVTDRLKAGRNALGLMLGNGRFYAPRMAESRTFGFPRALLQLEVENDDGSRVTIASDTSWKLSTKGPIRANNEYDGEEYDARMEPEGWSAPGFDDSGWTAAAQVSAPTGVLASQNAEPLRVTETLKPVKATPHGDGAWIFDMGQNMVGWCRLHVTGPSGTRVSLRFAETLKPDGTLYTDNLRSAKAADYYTLKGGGTETWEPRFTYHGFRFVEVRGYPGTPGVDALEGRVVHDDMERIADFSSSNPLLNSIHHNIAWGMRGNYRSIPTDCPQRDERQGWLGDRSQVSRSESYFFDIAAFYTKWMRDLEDAQKPSGSIPDVVPTYWVLYHDDVTWPSTFIFVPGMLYDQYGDRRVIERYYPSLKKWIGHMRGFLKDGLLPKDQYADWCVPPEDLKLIHSKDPARVTSGTLIGTAYYCGLLDLMARYARIVDQFQDASEFEHLAGDIRAAFIAKYFHPETARYDNGTQTSSVLALAFGLTPPDAKAAVAKELARKVSDESANHVGVGLIGAQWLMRMLCETGRADLAYTVATQKTYPGWGYMVERGATTMWELWNGDTADPAMNSGNHVMQIGDLGVWMYEYLAGIRPDPEKPGFKHIVIRPYVSGDLTYVGASHQSPYGKIASRWERNGGKLKLNLSVPANTTATIWVPGDPQTVREGAGPAAESHGLRFLRADSGYAVYEAGSGEYAFTSELAEK